MSQKDDFDLQEWRRIRAEQDQAYQDSLKADIAKVSWDHLIMDNVIMEPQPLNNGHCGTLNNEVFTTGYTSSTPGNVMTLSSYHIPCL